MPTIEQDRIFFLTGLDELPDYLTSKELYWPLTSSQGDLLPRLTIGGMLLAQIRLKVRLISPASQDESDRWVMQLDEIRGHWRVAWECKVEREIRSRMDMWRNFLLDYSHSPERYADDYQQEVHWRTILHLLSAQVTRVPPELEALTELDQILKDCFVNGGFIWERDLISGFPQQEFWFLYGKLESSKLHDK